MKLSNHINQLLKTKTEVIQNMYRFKTQLYYRTGVNYDLTMDY